MPAFGTPVKTPASLSTAAPFNIAPGATPTSPVNGDVWTTATGLFVRINGSTVGPLSAAGGGGGNIRKETLSSTFVNNGFSTGFYWADVAQTVSYLISTNKIPSTVYFYKFGAVSGTQSYAQGTMTTIKDGEIPNNTSGTLTLAEGEVIGFEVRTEGERGFCHIVQTGT